MDALEQELIIRFIKLDLATKQQVLALADKPHESSDFDELMRMSKALQDELLEQHGEMSVVDMVNEVRQEHEDDLIHTHPIKS
ncbi:MAG: hypothetical protein MUE54_07345 [Anaerolineae bacterium]|nr:hypothetical protein [Anaerolineae bacterium]